MALVNFKKGLLANLPSSYAEGTLYVTTDERAIYLDVAADKRIRLGDFQEFATLAALEANANPSTSALYYITKGNILAKWDGEKYVQINVQKTLAELGGVSKAEFDRVVYDQGEGEAKVKGLISKVADLESTVDGIVSVGGEANVIETVKVNGTALTVTDKAVDITVPTGALASKDSVAKADLTSDLSAEIDNKVVKEAGKSLISDSEITRLAGMSDGANKVEASETNGSIKIDGVDTVVYTHPEKHAIADVTGLQDALNAKVNAVDYNADKATFALKSEVESAIGSVHTHDNKDELDLIKSGDVAKWNGEIGTKAIVDANKATWDLAATALQSHQDISHLATEADLTGIKGRIDVVEGILNDKTEGEVTTKGLVSRVEVLEAIDHDKLAEDASAAAVAAVLDGAPEKFDTLKEIAAWIADANTAEDAASLVTRVSTIEGDYLKKADKTELEGKITAIDNHSHTNKDELDKINDGDVAKWNNEIGVKAIVDANKATWDKAGTALQASDLNDLNNAKHTHDNKALLDTYTQTEADLADAVAKKHEHANKAVIDGITAEKVTAWDAAEQNAKDYVDTKLTWGTF